ncbi:glucose-6-phosphate dehydrogenase [Bacillus salitolerans]|uniref:Glucose-6-phosphate 1-dehydrogenase n=1 Tax=Bacillus salitolerans TaxID=1437434 RepID=A0ABW4LJJ5_9BACI
MNIENPKSLIVIFGATGDLANRKLFPSIYRLFIGGKLSKHFGVIGVARRPKTNDEFRTNVKEALQEASIPVSDEAIIDEFCRHFFYHPFDVTNKDSYQSLNQLLSSLDEQFQVGGNRIFYLAMAPEFFGTIASKLKSEGLTDTAGWKRLVIEKPFGHNSPSAEELNEKIRDAFSEDEIYRIDHYLGKEMVQNIEVIRFANALFEPLWNNRYISNIQITSSETLGVGDRASYYEKSGALRDMVQNHMLQMVALLAMEPPSRLQTEEVRSEKVKVLRSLRRIHIDEVDDYFVRGQYDRGTINGKETIGYREENGTEPESNTETFVAGKLLIDNFRWAGVPFYIRTGKRMTVKSTKIVIEFKDMPMNLYFPAGEERRPNVLVIHIQPDEGITLHINAKSSGPSSGTIPIKMDYSNNSVNSMNTPEAYERLLYDCLRGDATNFTHWDEVALSWKFIDSISEAWAMRKANDFPNYAAGSMGPTQSDMLLEKDGFHWWPLDH